MTPLRLVASVAAGVVSALGVVTLTPSSLGGTTTWVSTQGISMEPGMHEGDLVLARPRPSYEVGDVVAYPSDTLRRTVVLHRIVDENADGNVTQGDNNSWLDPDTPTAAEILGARWLHVPNGGKVIKVFADPLVIATLFVAVALLGWLVSAPARRRRRGPPSRSRGARSSGDVTRPGSLAAVRPEHAAVLGAAAVAMGLFAVTQPTSVGTTRSVEVDHRLDLGYSAQTDADELYLDGEVRTGDPVFLAVAPRLTLTGTWTPDADVADPTGTLTPVAVLSAGNGWTREVPLGAPVALPDAAASTDPAAVVETEVDLRALLQRFRSAEEAAGTLFGGYTVELAHEAQVQGTVEGREVEQTLRPALTLSLSDTVATLQGEPSSASATQSVGVPDSVTNTVALLRWDVPVLWLRVLAGLLLLAATAVARLSLVTRGSRSREASAFGPRLVTASAHTLGGAAVVDVLEPAALRKIAEKYDEVVLAVTDGAGPAYLVHTGGTTYRYRPATPGTDGAGTGTHVAVADPETPRRWGRNVRNS